MKKQSLAGEIRCDGTTGNLLRKLSVFNTISRGLSIFVAASFLAAGPVFAQSSDDEAALIEGAKEEGSLTIIHGMPQVAMEAFAEEFKKKYPFISVEIERQQGLAVYEKFNAETRGGANLRDIVMVADVGGYRKLVEDGMIMNHRVPNDADIPAQFKIDGYAYVAYLTEILIAVNSQLVSEEEGSVLREWEGILDPRWKGRIGTTYPSGGSGYGPLYMYLHSEYADRFGEKFLKAVAAQEPQIFSSTATALERLISGEIEVLFTHWESHILPKWAKGAPVRWYSPVPTPSYGNSYFGIAAKAPHPNAAKLFLNWFMSDEGATEVNKIYGSKSTVASHTDQRNLPKDSWYMPITETYTPDPDGWIEHHDADVKLWSEIFNYNPGIK